MTRTIGVAAVVLGLMVMLMLCGCGSSGYIDENGNWNPGSYDGGSATLSRQGATVNLTDITADFGTSKGSGTFHFWANQEGHAAIEMSGSYSITGSAISATATPVVGTTAQKAADSLTMSLDIHSATQLDGSVSYTQSSATYGGDISFTRFANQ
ncbi:MAG: hypothetical protein WCP21_00905 [Armatimonadota bacterium]